MLNAKRSAMTFALALIAGVGAAPAQSFGPLGTEFQANTYTTNNQQYPSVATDASGNFVVVWQSSPRGEGGGQDGSYSGIFGQRFTSAGADVGTEFQINTYTTNSQYTPDVAATPDGRFVVVWTSYAQDGYGSGIFGQRFDSAGALAGTEFQVNTFTTGGQRTARVANNPAGDFVVVWASFPQDGDGSGIFAQRFNSSGGKLGTEFQVNSVSSSNQVYPDVAVDSAGRFVVVWNTSYPEVIVFGRRFDSAGAPLGTDFQLSNLAGDRESYPAVAADTSGGFVVAWQAAIAFISTGPTVVDNDGFSIQARQFNSAGVPLGSQFQVNTYTTSGQTYPAIATAPSGDFVVAWRSGSYYGAEPDGSGSGVFGQRFSSNGTFLGTEFLVNTYTTLAQQYPAIAAGPNDFFVVAWQSNGNENYDLVVGAPQLGPRDPSLFGVFGQRFIAAAPAVAPGTAPALSPTAIVLLAMGLCAVGIFTLVRQQRRA